MTQLILDTSGYNLALPESKKGGYTIERKPLSVDVEMISGRMVRELRGNVWVISYQYGYFYDEMKEKVIAACEKGKRAPIMCGFLPPDHLDSLQYSSFFVTEFNRPKFMWSREVDQPTSNPNVLSRTPIPVWGDFSLTLREVRPSD